MRNVLLSIILKRQHIGAFQTLESNLLDVKMISYICDLALEMQKSAIHYLHSTIRWTVYQCGKYAELTKREEQEVIHLR